LGAYAVVQLLLPARALLYPGPAAWTEEGATFAWRMMLRDKRGSVQFLVRNRVSGTTRRVSPGPLLTKWQLRTLVGTPDLILQLAHWLADRERERVGGTGPDDVQVRAMTKVRLNGRPARPLVNPRVDLAHEPRTLRHYTWVLPAPNDAD
jgi:hypothetical protein